MAVFGGKDIHRQRKISHDAMEAGHESFQLVRL